MVGRLDEEAKPVTRSNYLRIDESIEGKRDVQAKSAIASMTTVQTHQKLITQVWSSERCMAWGGSSSAPSSRRHIVQAAGSANSARMPADVAMTPKRRSKNMASTTPKRRQARAAVQTTNPPDCLAWPILELGSSFGSEVSLAKSYTSTRSSWSNGVITESDGSSTSATFRADVFSLVGASWGSLSLDSGSSFSAMTVV